ncbi:hypothetical protein E2320_012818, partial [Naja naja]
CCQTEVIILFGDPHTNANVQSALHSYIKSTKSLPQKVWILSSQWKHNVVAAKDALPVIKPFHGALQLRDHTGDISEFRHFLVSLDPLNPEGDIFLPRKPTIGLVITLLVGMCTWESLLFPLFQTSKQTHFCFLCELGVGFEFSQGERSAHPSFFRINPKESPQYVGLIQLLLHFQWNWVGLVAPESDNGEHFISIVMPMLKEKEICVAFTEILKPDDFVHTWNTFHVFLKKCCQTEVIILFGDPHTNANVQSALHFYVISTKSPPQKVWILSSQWKHNVVAAKDALPVIKPFHGALQLRDHTGDISEFRHFLVSLDPLNPEGDIFLPQWTNRGFDHLAGIAILTFLNPSPDAASLLHFG